MQIDEQLSAILFLSLFNSVDAHETFVRDLPPLKLSLLCQFPPGMLFPI